MRAVVAVMADLDAGQEVYLCDAKARFGLAWGRDRRQNQLRRIAW